MSDEVTAKYADGRMWLAKDFGVGKAEIFVPFGLSEEDLQIFEKKAQNAFAHARIAREDSNNGLA